MLIKLILFILNINLIFGFIYNIKITKAIDCKLININKNYEYNNKLCKWYTNNWLNYNKNSKIVNKNNIIYNENNLENLENIQNNTLTYFVDNNNIKIYTNNNIIFNNEYRILIFIINPINNDYKFYIKIIYNKKNKNLIGIELNRCSEKSFYNNYWSDNINLKYLNKPLINNPFLFGINYHLSLPLPLESINNEKKNILKKKYPYLYEYKNNLNNLILKLPDNIFLDIPKFINLNKLFNIKVKWKFQNDYYYNLLNINYNNSILNDLNLFKFKKKL